MTRVAVLGARGTIAGVAESRVAFHRYRSGRLSAAEMVGALRPEIDAIADVSAADFPGEHLTLTGLRDLSLAVGEALREADAVVVTTGTNELSEVAYWLDLTVAGPKPVVVTGSMRPWNVIGSDAPANLYNAVLLAASGRTARLGTVVMLNDEIHAARDVTKSDAQRLHTFRSPGLGPLGTVDGDHIRIRRAPARGPAPVDPAGITAMPRVEIVPGYLDAGPEILTALAGSGTGGIVVAGSLSPRQKDAARSLLRDGMVFVAAPAAAGAVHPEPPVIGAGCLQPRKARLLLVLCLAATRDPEEIRARFAADADAGPPLWS